MCKYVYISFTNSVYMSFANIIQIGLVHVVAHQLAVQQLDQRRVDLPARKVWFFKFMKGPYDNNS